MLDEILTDERREFIADNLWLHFIEPLFTNHEILYALLTMILMTHALKMMTPLFLPKMVKRDIWAYYCYMLSVASGGISGSLWMWGNPQAILLLSLAGGFVWVGLVKVLPKSWGHKIMTKDDIHFKEDIN